MLLLPILPVSRKIGDRTLEKTSDRLPAVPRRTATAAVRDASGPRPEEGWADQKGGMAGGIHCLRSARQAEGGAGEASVNSAARHSSAAAAPIPTVAGGASGAADVSAVAWFAGIDSASGDAVSDFSASTFW